MTRVDRSTRCESHRKSGWSLTIPRYGWWPPVDSRRLRWCQATSSQLMRWTVTCRKLLYCTKTLFCNWQGTMFTSQIQQATYPDRVSVANPWLKPGFARHNVGILERELSGRKNRNRVQKKWGEDTPHFIAKYVNQTWLHAYRSACYVVVCSILFDWSRWDKVQESLQPKSRLAYYCGLQTRWDTISAPVVASKYPLRFIYRQCGKTRPFRH